MPELRRLLRATAAEELALGGGVALVGASPFLQPIADSPTSAAATNASRRARMISRVMRSGPAERTGGEVLPSPSARFASSGLGTVASTLRQIDPRFEHEYLRC